MECGLCSWLEDGLLENLRLWLCRRRIVRVIDWKIKQLWPIRIKTNQLVIGPEQKLARVRMVRVEMVLALLAERRQVRQAQLGAESPSA